MKLLQNCRLEGKPLHGLLTAHPGDPPGPPGTRAEPKEENRSEKDPLNPCRVCLLVHKVLLHPIVSTKQKGGAGRQAGVIQASGLPPLLACDPGPHL